MDISEAAEHMADMYTTAPHGEKATMMDLFGVKYVQELDSMAQDRSVSPRQGTQRLTSTGGPISIQQGQHEERDEAVAGRDRSRDAWSRLTSITGPNGHGYWA